MPFICSIGVSLPEFTATNAYVKNLAHCYSGQYWSHLPGKLEHMINLFFQKSGAEYRLWRNANTLPKDHLREAVDNCFSEVDSGFRYKLSSIIFCGIDRGFVEPAHASAFAAKIGLNGVRAFDVSDACLGWFTACEVATAFASPDFPFSLIVSAEFPLDDPGLVIPETLTIRNETEFAWKSAALTLGEMATATLIDANKGITSSVVYSENQHYDLCIVPIKKPTRFIDWRYDKELIDSECFIANGAKLAASGFRVGLKTLKDQVKKSGIPDFIVPHAFSETVPRMVANRLDLEDKIYNVFSKVGNISTSSIPFGLWSLSQEYDLSSKKLLGWIASAGMKHSAFEIKWIGG